MRRISSLQLLDDGTRLYIDADSSVCNFEPFSGPTYVSLYFIRNTHDKV